MLKKFHPQMTKVLIGIVCLLSLVGIVVYEFFPYFSSYLIAGTIALLPSSPHCSLFYGETIDMSRILPTSQHYVVNSNGQDLIDIAADLGVNLIRITNGVRSFDNKADSIYTKEQWDQVLRKMQSKGMKALIVIEVVSSNGDYYTPDIRPAYLHLVQEYIDSGVFANPNVYAVDIKNEPLLADANVKMLQAAHAMIKAKYPDLKQTVGGWAIGTNEYYHPYNWVDFPAGRVIDNIVDFYSVHMYIGLDSTDDAIGLNPNLRTKWFLSRVQKGLQTTKPILIEEFGEANGGAVSDQNTIGSPELQAIVYQGVYQALEDMHNSQILGAVAFQFYSRTSYPDAWAIVKDNGDYLLPAAYILQEYALGKKNLSRQVATVVHSQSYLASDAENNSKVTLHISDRLGFLLYLDKSTHYSISLSADGLLQPLDVLHYDSIHQDYRTVYQATSTGSVQLSIIPDTGCQTGMICNQPVYTLTVNIQ